MVGASVADRFSTSVPVVILLVDFFSLYPPQKEAFKELMISEAKSKQL
jgi:hypothetical protein